MTGNSPISVNLSLLPSEAGSRINPPEQARYPSATPMREKPPEFHTEVAIPGVELDNYTKRVASEDGQYVIITKHSERIEKIKQPPTPEEIAAQEAKQEKARADKRAQDVLVAKVIGALGTVAIATMGVYVWFDSHRAATPVRPRVKYTPIETESTDSDD